MLRSYQSCFPRLQVFLEDPGEGSPVEELPLKQSIPTPHQILVEEYRVRSMPSANTDNIKCIVVIYDLR